jgi:hypothetical protein
VGFWKKYARYVEDNPEGYWFKRKIYGWGWAPVTWQGWLVTLGFVALLAAELIRIDSNSHSVSDTLYGFTPEVILFAAIFTAILYAKGEPPKWQWGFPEDERK